MITNILPRFFNEAQCSNTLDLGQNSELSAGHMSGLMNAVSQSTEAQLCHQHDMLMHCLAGRQSRLMTVLLHQQHVAVTLPVDL